MPTYWPASALDFKIIETAYIDYNYRFYNCNSQIKVDLTAASGLD